MKTFLDVWQGLGVVFSSEQEHNRAKDWFERGAEAQKQEASSGQLDGLVGKRDYFASAALTGIMARWGSDGYDSTGVEDAAYIIADKMLERSKH